MEERKHSRSPFVFDLRLVGLFRVLLALTILMDQFIRISHWEAFQASSGLVSAADSRAWHSAWMWSLYWLSDGPWLPYVLEVLRLLATLTLLLGIRSRLSAFVLFVLMASIINRSPLLLQGGDEVLLVMIFFAMFLPLGVYGSLEHYWFGRTPRMPTYCSVATVAYSVQVLAVWFMAGILKTGEEWAGSGTALSLSLHLEAFAGEFARLWRGWDWLVRPMTFFALWVERLAPLLVLVPSFWCRLAGLAALVSLEIGMWLNLELGLFPLISVVSLVPLFPPRFVDAVVRWWSRRKGDDGVGFGDRLYGWIDRNRDAFGSAGALCFGRSSAGSRSGLVGRFVVLVALVVVVAWNVVTYPPVVEWRDMRLWIEPAVGLFRLRQYWNMFSPPPDVDTYHVMPALARDGSRINLLPNRAISLEPPRDGPDHYGSYRWRKTVIRSAILHRIDRVNDYFCRTGQWEAIDLWEFRRANLGVAATVDGSYTVKLLGRTKCGGADESTVEAFRADIDAMMDQYNKLRAGDEKGK